MSVAIWPRVLAHLLLPVVLALVPVRGQANGSDDPAERLRVVSPRVIWIQDGWFWRGSDLPDLEWALDLCRRYEYRAYCLGGLVHARLLSEAPRHRVFVGPFGLDRTEVTNLEWQRCVEGGGCPPSRLSTTHPEVSSASHPVAGITWYEARDYCAFVGGRLPTETEWEFAARGDSLVRRFPWGQAYNDRAANHGSGRFEPDALDGYEYSAPVDAFPSDVSPFGILHMAGNVMEWTADHYADRAYDLRPWVNPTGPESGGDFVVRGGSWISPPFELRTTYRRGEPAGQARGFLGVRCAYDAR